VNGGIVGCFSAQGEVMSVVLADWFWALLDDASEQVCDYWRGPTVDGIAFSEDDTEDLCDRVVSRGAGFWRHCLRRFQQSIWRSLA
jgi:hypothetical protein